MTRPERIAIIAGLALVAVAAGLFDWRLGLLVAGLILIVSAIDVRRST